MLIVRTREFLDDLSHKWHTQIDRQALNFYRLANASKPNFMADKEYETLVSNAPPGSKNLILEKLKITSPKLRIAKLKYKKVLKLNIVLRYIKDLELKYKYMLKCVSLIGKKGVSSKIKSKLNSIDNKLRYIFNKLKDPKIALQELEMNALANMQADLASDVLEAERELVKLDEKHKAKFNASLLPKPPIPEELDDFLLDPKSEAKLKKELSMPEPELTSKFKPDVELNEDLEQEQEKDLTIKADKKTKKSLKPKPEMANNSKEEFNEKLEQVTPTETNAQQWLRQQRMHGERNLDRQVEYKEAAYEADNPFQDRLMGVTSSFAATKYSDKDLDANLGNSENQHMFKVFKNTFDELTDLASGALDTLVGVPESSNIASHPGYIDIRMQMSCDEGNRELPEKSRNYEFNNAELNEVKFDDEDFKGD